jgi:hypothetical protein
VICQFPVRAVVVPANCTGQFAVPLALFGGFPVTVPVKVHEAAPPVVMVMFEPEIVPVATPPTIELELTCPATVQFSVPAVLVPVKLLPFCTTFTVPVIVQFAGTCALVSVAEMDQLPERSGGPLVLVESLPQAAVTAMVVASSTHATARGETIM